MGRTDADMRDIQVIPAEFIGPVVLWCIGAALTLSSAWLLWRNT